MSDRQIISDGIELAESIRPLLAGKKPEVIDSALAKLFAMVLAVRHPDVRERMLSKHMLLIGRMVPTMDKEIFSRQNHVSGIFEAATTLGLIHLRRSSPWVTTP